jgi:hypothetical protein
MLGNYRMAAQLVASRAVLSSTELVIHGLMVGEGLERNWTEEGGLMKTTKTSLPRGLLIGQEFVPKPPK